VLCWCLAGNANTLDVGRATDQAFGVMLSGREDKEIQDYFIEEAFPEARNMFGVLAAIENSPGVPQRPDRSDHCRPKGRAASNG
jgi:F0F1-type ATP synthase membrane subunit c/vacuolar-type H+-ATPase subunit K